MITLFNYLLLSNIFTGGFVLIGAYCDLYLGYIFIAAFFIYALFFKKIVINRNFVYILTVFFIFSFLNVIFKNNSFPLLLKTTMGFIINGAAYYSLIRLNNNNIDKLFRIYLQFVCIVVFIGVFQEISYLIGFKYGYDFTSFIPRTMLTVTDFGWLRIPSILPEPAHFGGAIAPAVFVAISNIINNKRNYISKKMSCLIILSILLTFSLVAYLSIIVAFILVMINQLRRKLIVVSGIILLIFIFSAYLCIPEIRERVDDTINLVSGKTQLVEVNFSTYSVASNGLVALRSFMNNPLISSGLGSHPFSHGKYIAQIVDQSVISSGINKYDASSLLLRLISETGLLGVLLFFYFIFRFYVPKKRDEHYWIISNSIMCLFVLNLLRQGNYFAHGFIFFVWLYYFTSKNIELQNRNCS